MGLFNNKKIQELESTISEQNAKLDYLTNGFLFPDTFDGEKTAGELGVPRTIYPDYYSARERGWEMQLTNGYAKTIIKKWANWIVGTGLRFNCTPSDRVLGEKKEKYVSDIEYRFRLYKQSKQSDYAKSQSLDSKAIDGIYNALTAGDVLVVCRVENGIVTNQLIDGANVVDPIHCKADVNVLDGVEYNDKGQIVAYHVYTDDNQYIRVPARDPKTGLLMAWMIYGSKFRLNETRGVPELLEDYEKIKSMERYHEAVVKKAEILANVVFVNEHDNSSTGEDVFKTGQMKGLSGTSSKPDPTADLPTPKKFQKNFNRMSKGAVINNTIGASLKMLNVDGEANMPEFMDANNKHMSPASGMPGEVALSSYNSNYNASRAARLDFGHELAVRTKNIAIDQFYKPIYDLWLYNEILNGKIDGFELIKALLGGDYITYEDLSNATFTGTNIPSTDPVKELNAIRLATGDNTTPYMSNERACELASNSDYTELQAQIKRERKITVDLMDNQKPQQNNNTGNGKD